MMMEDLYKVPHMVLLWPSQIAACLLVNLPHTGLWLVTRVAWVTPGAHTGLSGHIRPRHATPAHTNTDPGASSAGLSLVICDLIRASYWSIGHLADTTRKWPHTAQEYGQGVSGPLRFRIFILDRHVRWGRSRAVNTLNVIAKLGSAQIKSESS